MSRVPPPFVIFLTGFLLLSLSVGIGWFLLPAMINDQIAQQVKLQNGTEVFEKWKDPPVPIYFKVYLFNVTNPDQIVTGLGPKFQEVGPFVYREYREKIEIEENPSESRVKYKEKVTYYFDPERSGGLTEDVELTILNIPYVAMAQKVSELTYPLNDLAFTYIIKFKEKPFIKRTAKDILFQGWKIPMVAELSEFLEQELMPNSTFGLFYGKNGTDDGFLEVDSGLTSTSNFGKILSWRGLSSLPWWADSCAEIAGTDGSIFPPFVTKERVIHIFNADLCRSLYLTFNSEVSFLGISAYRFTAPPEVLEDPKTSEANRCYCQEEEVDSCLRGGSIDLSVCREGAPVAMSTPYFLNGYQGYQNATGLTPSKFEHETLLDIEPTTGIVLHAHKRIQINVILKPVPQLRSLSQMPEMLFPIVWADETAEIDADLASILKTQLIVPLTALEIGRWALFGISVLLMISASIRWISGSKEEQDPEPDLQPSRYGFASVNANANQRNAKTSNRNSRNPLPKGGDKEEKCTTPFIT